MPSFSQYCMVNLDKNSWFFILDLMDKVWQLYYHW